MPFSTICRSCQQEIAPEELPYAIDQLCSDCRAVIDTHDPDFEVPEQVAAPVSALPNTEPRKVALLVGTAIIMVFVIALVISLLVAIERMAFGDQKERERRAREAARAEQNDDERRNRKPPPFAKRERTKVKKARPKTAAQCVQRLKSGSREERDEAVFVLAHLQNLNGNQDVADALFGLWKQGEYSEWMSQALRTWMSTGDGDRILEAWNTSKDREGHKAMWACIEKLRPRGTIRALGDHILGNGGAAADAARLLESYGSRAENEAIRLVQSDRRLAMIAGFGLMRKIGGQRSVQELESLVRKGHSLEEHAKSALKAIQRRKNED